jgi:hypothetical protein
MSDVHLFMISSPPLGLTCLLAPQVNLTSINIKDGGDWGNDVMKHRCDEQWHLNPADF